MNRKSAFTFVELLWALTLFALLMTSVLYVFQANTRGIALTKEEIAVHCAGFELVEQLLSIPYDDLPVGTFDSYGVSRLKTEGVGSAAWPLYISDDWPASRTLEISEFSLDGRARYKKIIVNVILPAAVASGTPRTFSRTVLYAKETL